MEHLDARSDKGSNKPNYDLVPLTIREKQVLELLCEGLSNEEIAKALEIQVLTVKCHLKKVYVFFHTSRRHCVIIQAVKSGMVRPSWIKELRLNC